MARDLGVSVPTVFAAFSVALVVSALLGPLAGKLIDRWGGRTVLSWVSPVFALGLAALASASGTLSLFLAWAIIGAAMAAGLYEGAFAALVRLYGRDARGAITGVTLFAGFASTVGWPLTTWLELQYGWRDACMAWAALHLLLALPLNCILPAIAPSATEAAAVPEAAASQDVAADPSPQSPLAASVLLAFVFAVTWFISTAMAAHLPRLLQADGASLASAVAFAALVGPAQVAGRLLEYGLLRHIHPLVSARAAGLAHSAGAAAFLVLGGPFAGVFTVLHGAGNGILTIAKGTLPLVMFGPQGYGARQGLLMVPARFAQAMAPWLFGLLIDRHGMAALWFSTALGLAGFAALMVLRAEKKPA